MPHITGSTLKPLVKLGKTPEACWSWLGPVDDRGYGKKQLGGKTLLAHRWIWSQMFGPIPDSITIFNTCGSIGCINPHHLRAGTDAERCRNGAGATLTPGDVLEIKRAKKTRTIGTAGLLADRYGVSKRLIFDIWGDRAWTRAGARSRAEQLEQGAAA